MIQQQVAHGGDGVGLIQHQGLVADHDVPDPVFAPHAGKPAAFVCPAAAFDIGTDLKAQARDLQERGKLMRYGIRAPLQRVQQLLAGDFHDGDVVVERIDRKQVVQRDVALWEAGANARAAGNGHVRAGLNAEGIRDQVAQVGFRCPDDAHGLSGCVHSRGIEDGLRHRTDAHLCFQPFAQRGQCAVHDLGHFVLNAQQLRRGHRVAPGVEAGVDAPVRRRDPHPADAVQLGTAGLADDRFAVPVFHDHLVRVVTVAVQHGVDAGGVFEHLRIGEGDDIILVAQMPQQNDVIRALGTGVIHRALNGGIQVGAVVVLHESVDQAAVFIQEGTRRGGEQHLWRGDAHKGQLYAVKFPDDIGRKQQLSLPVEVAADVGEVCRLRQVQEALDAVVELVIAGDGDIIAQPVHHMDDRLALGQKAHGFALYGVAVVNQQHVAALALKLVFDSHQPHVPKALVHTAVDVAGEQHHDILLQLRFALAFREGRSHRQKCQRDQHTADQAQQTLSCSSHGILPPVSFCCLVSDSRRRKPDPQG